MAKTPWWKRLFTRPAVAPEQHERVITEFAVIDGVPVTGSGEAVQHYRGGMSIPGAWRAALLISDLLGSVPWDAYRKRAGNPIEKLEPAPPLLEHPAPPDNRMTTFSSWALDVVWHGNAVGVIAARNVEGWPTAVLPVPAQMVGVRRITETGYSPLPVGEIEYNIGPLKLGVYDVIHIKGPCPPGALRGFGVLEAHMDTMDLAREQINQAKSVSQHGVPTGILKVSNPDATKKDLQDAKKGWLDAQSSRTIATLNATTEFEPLAWRPDEMQMVEARRYTLTDLENIFGLPVGWLGGMNSARQYSNIEQDAVNLLKFTLSGHLARFEQTLAQAFPRGTTVKANLDAVLRPDTLTRYQAHAIGLDKGFLTEDEVREMEDRPPLPEEEKPTPPAKLIPLPTPTEEENNDEPADPDQENPGQQAAQG